MTERSPLANSAFDMLLKITTWKVKKKRKKGLESQGGIAGMSVAECKTDQPVMSAGAANKIPGILKYSNFSLTSKSMCASGKLTILERAWI